MLTPCNGDGKCHATGEVSQSEPAPLTTPNMQPCHDFAEPPAETSDPFGSVVDRLTAPLGKASRKGLRDAPRPAERRTPRRCMLVPKAVRRLPLLPQRTGGGCFLTGLLVSGAF